MIFSPAMTIPYSFKFKYISSITQKVYNCLLIHHKIFTYNFLLLNIDDFTENH